MQHFWFDVLGSLFSLSATLLFILESALAWPISLLAIAINGILYFNLGIYGDFSLEIIYALLSVYGWYNWAYKGRDKTRARISFINSNYYLPLLLIAVFSIICSYKILILLGSTIALLDAFTTVLSIIAQWMTAKKYIETWVLWLIVDFSYIFIYAIKGIPFHSMMLFVYCFLAFAGFYRWYRAMHAAEKAITIRNIQ